MDRCRLNITIPIALFTEAERIADKFHVHILDLIDWSLKLNEKIEEHSDPSPLFVGSQFISQSNLMREFVGSKTRYNYVTHPSRYDDLKKRALDNGRNLGSYINASLALAVRIIQSAEEQKLCSAKSSAIPFRIGNHSMVAIL